MKRIIFLAAAACLTIGVCNASDDIKYGPWITNVSDNSMTVLWTSNTPGLGWVETSDGVRKYDCYAGRRTFGCLHTVKLKGLDNGKPVRYRVGGQILLDDSNPRYPEFGEEYAGAWNEVRIFNSDASECRFSVMNDIHMDTLSYKALASQIDVNATDFLFLNGDIISTGNYQTEDYVKYEISPIASVSSTLPLQFARGNHEGRGTGIKYVRNLYPNDVSQNFYYTFRHGPVAFIVFDGGETGRDRSVLYSGGDVYEDYINEQLEWARTAMQEPSFRDAPVKVCMLHVPMIDHPKQDDFHLQRYLNKYVVPLLNEAGVNLMIGADLHVYMVCEAGTMANTFPIIVNATRERLDCTYRNGHFYIKVFSPKGEILHEIEF